jgi:hypothetical protein
LAGDLGIRTEFGDHGRSILCARDDAPIDHHRAFTLGPEIDGEPDATMAAVLDRGQDLRRLHRNGEAL